jgi:threonylcarbamoyladenosine tRNA methylthiotransferase MtaB
VIDLTLNEIEFLNQYNRKKTVSALTLGCRVNQYETEAMIEKFMKEGYESVNFNECADVYIINTCTVTNMGDKKSRQMIHRARKKNKDAVIAVVGCYSQVSPEEVSNIESVDVVLGSRNKGDIVYWINRYINENEKIVEVNKILKNNIFEDLNIDKYQHRTRAFLKIQDGCNRFCSYCLIPFARGAVCSKEPYKVIEEVKKLAHNNFKEIILSGIHIASYGTDLKDGWNLLRLLQEIDQIEGIQRVRIGSIDPQFFTEEVVENIKYIKKLCPHFHLSLQSGCDETLKRMNRRYTASEYEGIVNELRDYLPGVSITTDVIIGFPGETEEEFNSTYNFLKKMELSKTHIFKYSKREGTPAAKFKDQVDYTEKERRSNLLIKLNLVNEKKFIDRFIGEKLEVLYEQECNDMEGFIEGYTDNYIYVKTKGSKDMIGNICNTTLVENSGEFAIGRI